MLSLLVTWLLRLPSNLFLLLPRFLARKYFKQLFSSGGRTDPTNASSVLKMLAANPGESGITVQWQSVSGKYYYLERAANLVPQPAFARVYNNLFGQPGGVVKESVPHFAYFTNSRKSLARGHKHALGFGQKPNCHRYLEFVTPCHG